MTPKQAINKVEQLCSKQERCEYDMSQKLIKWEINPEQQQDRVDFLYANKFLNQHRYTNAYVKDKSTISKWGSEKIRMMLKQKRVDPTIIQESLSLTEVETQIDNCITILKQKAKLIKKDKNDYYKYKAKLIRFAMSRGFTMEQINKALKSLDIKSNWEDNLFD